MSSRDDILASIRANRPQVERPLPAIPLFDDRAPPSVLAAFKESLQRMGGIFLDPPNSSDVLAPLRDKIRDAKVVCSTVPEIAGNRDISGSARRKTWPMSILPSCALPSAWPRQDPCC